MIGSKQIPHSISSFSSVVGVVVVVEAVDPLLNLSLSFSVALVGIVHSFDNAIGPFVLRRFA